MLMVLQFIKVAHVNFLRLGYEMNRWWGGVAVDSLSFSVDG